MDVDEEDVLPQISDMDFEILSELEKLLPLIGDEKEWEETRCPICMDHPHNVVLLLCSSSEKGCRPYICNTSNLQSNCLNTYLNKANGELSTSVQNVSITQSSSMVTVEQTLLRPNCSWQHDTVVHCPYCRGQVNGWIVMEDIRRYMNSKIRDCSMETCNFSGNYTALMDHANTEHPTVKPLDVDPERQAEWERLEYETEFRDLLEFQYERDENYDHDYGEYNFGHEFDLLPRNYIVNRGTNVVRSGISMHTDPSTIWSIFGSTVDYPGYESTAINSNSENYTGGGGGGDDHERGRDWYGTDSRSEFDIRRTREKNRYCFERRTGGRSFYERLVARRRSNSNKVIRITSSHGRWNGFDSPSHHH